MNKLAVLTLIGSVLLSSCKNDNYQLTGQVEGAQDGDTVFIAKLEGNNFIPSDTLIIKKGTFSSEGKINKDSTEIYSYYYSNGNNTYTNMFFLEPGNIQLSIANQSRISGSETNNIYQEVLDSLIIFHNQMNQVYEKMIAEQDSSKRHTELKTLENLDQKVNEFIQGRVEKNIKNSAGYVLFLTNYTLFAPNKVQELINELPERYKKQSFIEEIKAQLQPVANNKVGEQFTDFTLLDPNGKEIKASDIIKKNKLTLIDCWASWCGPCIQEMPSLVNAYKKYRTKGLEILGVSLDNNKENWIDAVKRMNMTWPQVSDLQGWESQITKLYGIKSIPYAILVDQNGNIVAEKLRGEQLDAFIAKALK